MKFNLKNHQSSIINHQSDGGFTLAELLVAMSIIMILSAVTVVNLRTGTSEQALLRSAQTLAFNIRKAQNLALTPQPNTGKTICVYGVKAKASSNIHALYFNDDPVAGNSCNGQSKLKHQGNFSPPGQCSSCIDQIYLEKGVTIITAFDVSFKPPEPIVYSGGDQIGGAPLNITLTNGTITRTVKVNKFGSVEIQ